MELSRSLEQINALANRFLLSPLTQVNILKIFDIVKYPNLKSKSQYFLTWSFVSWFMAYNNLSTVSMELSCL